MTALQPSFDTGVAYWTSTDASVDGVLGGFGPQTAVPRLDAASSRMLLLSLIPELSTIVPPHRSSSSATGNTATKRSFRALDAGAGIGRVTSTVLLPLFHRVDLVEPVGKFLQEAEAAARKSSDDGWRLLASNTGAAEITKGTRGVRLWQAGLQYFDPSRPAVALAGGSSTLLATVSNAPQSISFPDPSLPITVEEGYDIVMIQWCVGHLSDEDFIAFLQRSQKVLRQENGELKGFIIVKENTCKDTEVGGQLFDDEDSSITRSDQNFKAIFVAAGLKLIRSEVQKGFPTELYPVISYVLR